MPRCSFPKADIGEVVQHFQTSDSCHADFSAVESFKAKLHNRVMIYVLAYPVFEPNSAERICAFRAEHEPERANLVPPHITLVFGAAKEHLQTISGLVDMASS